MSFEYEGSDVEYTDATLAGVTEEEGLEGVNLLTMTYAQLQDVYCSSGVEPQQLRTDRYALNSWCAFHGVEASREIGFEFSSNFERLLVAYINRMSKTKAEKTVRNLAGRIRVLQMKYIDLMGDDRIPQGFFDAVRFGWRRSGKTFRQVTDEYGGRGCNNWLAAKKHPSRHDPKTQEGLHRLEDIFKFPRDTLVSRAWPTESTVDIRLNTDIPYRRYQAIVSTVPYGLNMDELPSQVRIAVDRLVEHKKKFEHLLPDGEVAVLKPNQVWGSKDTVTMRVDWIGHFFGFLSHPKQTELTNDWYKSLFYGLGIQPEAMLFTQLVNKDLLFAFMRYTETRSFDKQHFLQYEAQVDAIKAGAQKEMLPILVRKTVPASFLVFARSMSNLVNRPYSFLCAHPEYGNELDPPVPEDQWTAWCKARHGDVRAIIRATEKKVGYGKRSNKEVLNEILRLPNPMAVFYELIQVLKDNMPHDLNPAQQAWHWRDITILEMLCFDPLRVKNFSLLNTGEHVIEKVGRLCMQIPAHEFKNHIHGHAEDRFRKLPDNVEHTVRTWLEVYRPRMAGHDITKSLFLRSFPSRLRTPRPDMYRLNGAEIGKIVRMLARKHFGVAIGPHSVRNVMTTTIAKLGGSPTQIKAALNDSEAIAMAIYRDIKNADEFDGLTDLYNLSRGNGK